MSVGGESLLPADYDGIANDWTGDVYSFSRDNPTAGSSKTVSITHGHGGAIPVAIFDVSGVEPGDSQFDSDDNLVTGTTVGISLSSANAATFSLVYNGPGYTPSVSGAQDLGQAIAGAACGSDENSGNPTWDISSSADQYLFGVSYSLITTRRTMHMSVGM